LDTALRRLSFARDARATNQTAPMTERAVADLVNRLNAQGVEVYGRLSPRVLLSLAEVALPQLHRYLLSLDPFAPARLPVSWAGESESQNWFDIARELTERWHHQQQIRFALDRPGIMTPTLYSPVLECFMRGLPHAYRDVDAPAGATTEITVAGDCGNTWRLQRHAGRWSLVARAEPGPIVSRTTMPQEIAWRVFTKGIDRSEARRQTSIEGDERIGSAVLGLTAIVA
ncbi:MAG: maleylpyruvate isomerase N-terminal domain-containing protein, partial [Vicinamibacterales bacterium]